MPIGVFERRLVEGLRVDRVLRQDRHQAEDQRQLAVVGVLDVEADAALADPLDPLDLGVVGAVVRPALVAEELEAEDHVVDRDRLAVGELRLRTDA